MAFTEFGGKPDDLKRAVRTFREFDWSGPDFVDKHLTMSNNPEKTSFGNLATQIGRAGKELGYKNLDMDDRDAIQNTLFNPISGIYIAAMHLKTCKDVGFANVSSENLTIEQIIITVTRYNRGLELPKSEIEKNTSYGRSIYKHENEIKKAVGK